MCLPRSHFKNMAHTATDHSRETVTEPGTPQARLNPPSGSNSSPKIWSYSVPSHPHLQHPQPQGRFLNMHPPLSPEQDLQVRKFLAELEHLHSTVRQSDAAIQHFLTNLPPTLKNLWQLEPRQWKEPVNTHHRAGQEYSQAAPVQGGTTWDPVPGGATQTQHNRYEGYQGSAYPSGYGHPPAAHVAVQGQPAGESLKRRRE